MKSNFRGFGGHPKLMRHKGVVSRRRLLLEQLEDRSLLSTFTVSNTADSGAGSLRQAILDANTLPLGLDTIAFNIPGAGVKTIAVSSQLPILTQPVIIDGYSQPLAIPNSDPTGFNGTLLIELTNGAGFGIDGLTIAGGNSIVRGLSIYGFSSAMGVIPPVQGHAIVLQGAGGNLIAGNLLGINVARTVGGNDGAGVFINGAAGNTVGGTTAAARNIMIANRNGVDIAGDAMGNLVQGNLLGLDENSQGISNVIAGVTIRDGASGNTVGGTIPAARNVISGNRVGVLISGVNFAGIPHDNVVQGNFIGTNIVGAGHLGNLDGVIITNSPNNVIGGLTDTPGTGPGNVIVGDSNGVFIVLDESTGNRLEGNLIGTNAAGSALPAPGGQLYSGVYIGGSGNTVGGPNPQTRNVISGSRSRGGIDLQGDSNVVENNFIGTDVTGTQDLGNGGGGIQIRGSNNHIRANVIAYSKVHTEEDDSTTGSGVLVVDGAGNAILSNSIFANALLGIELLDNGAPDGVPASNDGDDLDPGPNNLQNFPVVTGVAGSVISATINSTASTTFRVEFFASAAADPSGNGEGQMFLGFANFITGADGNTGTFTFSSPTSISGKFITATATRLDANLLPIETSEFSGAFTVQSAAPTVTINQAPGQADPTSSSAILFTVVFSSSVTDFTASDVSFAGSTVGGTLVSDVSGNGANYMVSVTGMTGNGTVLSSIPAGAAVNATSIPSAASTSIDNTVTFIAPPANADVSVTKTDSPDPVAAGGNLTYTIVVTNNGLGAAQSVVLSDAIPADTTFVLATQISGLAFTLSDPETDGTGTLTATIGTLPAGTSATFTLVVQVDSETEDGSEVTNTATVTTTTTDLNLANNSITETSIVGTEAVDECVVTTLNSPGAAGTATLGDDADNPGAGVLIVTGTSGDDVIVIGPRPGNARQIRITRNGQVIGEFSRSAMKHIVVFGLAGNDSISVATLSQPATLFGDAGNDSLTGGGGADRIDGGAGDDQLFGGSGADTLCGGDGNDFVNGQDGSDTMCGDVGNDRLIGEAGNDRLLGGDGNDGLDAGAGNDYLSGGTGTDSLAGGIGNDELRGGSGRDVLSGVAGDDLLYGGSGDDRLSGGTGNDLISGGAGDDRLNGDAGNDNISGGTGNDQINGGAGRDKLAGNGGNDTFSARDGARDTIDGGAGRDLVTADRSDTVRNVETVRRSRR